ncbi:MAG TPA: ABC transporter substrate-binding protein [Chloroflexota bacterium]|jgi:ABC-type nitrate/sulfonate/bicarbonate transport system substrate-binding protein
MRRALGVIGCLLTIALAACQPAARQGAPGADPADSAAAPAAQAAPADAPLKHLDLGYVAPSETFSIPWVAKETGLFAKYGLDVELHLVPGTPRLTQSLIAGDFDYAGVGAAAVMRARAQNADTLILASSGNYFTFKIMANAKSGLRSIAELRGHTVGVSQIGSTSHTFLKILLAHEGIPIDDVQIVQAGGNPEAAQAMLTGNLDASAVSGVMVPAAERAGAVTLADGRQLKIPSVNGALAATRGHIERDRDEVRRFMRAYVEAIHFYKTQREDTITIFQKYMSGLSRDETAYLYELGLEGYDPLPYPSDEAIKTELERDLDPPVLDMQPSDFYDVSFLHEMEQDGFVKTLYQ